MTTIEIDVTKLDEAGLTALAIIATHAVKIKLRRRKAYDNMHAAMTALRQAHFDLSNFIEGVRKTQSVRDVLGTDILTVIDRLVATAEIEGISTGTAPGLGVANG